LFKIGSVTGLTYAETMAARSSRTMVLQGLPFVTDTLEIGASGEGRRHMVFRRHAQAFFQANRYLIQHLVTRVTTLVPEGPVADLYAGVGLFALSLAAAAAVYTNS
jgi:tRNA/tmRNA/rRNA uracil-C5-methylase (TrmA/RlmC/RlmD family)